jgi:hypothetical protein
MVTYGVISRPDGGMLRTPGVGADVGPGCTYVRTGRGAYGEIVSMVPKRALGCR